ncbi:MAG: hypothetical protein R3Y46_03495 [Opitutales bacterium]
MITWIQLILQKHHKYVFSVLLFFIIIAFVFTIGSSIPFFGDRNPSYEANEQDFYGYNLRDERVMQSLSVATQYSMILAGQQIYSQEQFQEQVLTRAILLSIAKDMNMPTVSQGELDAYLRSLAVFANEDGSFSTAQFNSIMAELTNRFGKDYLNAMLLENALVAKVSALIAGTGFVQDYQIDSRFNALNSKYTFSVASLDMLNFKPEIAVDDAKLQEFFEANKLRYEVSEEVSLQVAFFPVTDFAEAKVEFTDEQLQAFYAANSSLFIIVKDGKQELESFDLAKSKVETEYKKAQILRMSQEKAQSFSDLVYDASTTFNSEMFNNLVAENNIAMQEVPAFKATDLEEAFSRDFPVEIRRAGLSLDTENWIYNEIVTNADGSYVVFLDRVKPSFVPALADIKIQVERDYKAAQTSEMFSAKASNLEKALSEALKGKKSFAETAKAEGAIIEDYAEICLTKLDEAQTKSLQKVYSLLDELTYMQEGEMSQMAILGGNAYIFFLTKAEKPELNKDSTEYKNLSAYLKRMEAMQSANALISEKFLKANEQSAK